MQVDKIPAKDLKKYFDFHITFNINSDHIEYSQFYDKIGVHKLRGIVYRKRILITTIGIKEFIVAFILKFIFLNHVVHSIHDWEPHPGKKYYVTKLYNYIASFLFQLSFYSFEQKSKSQSTHSLVHRLPILVKRLASKKTCKSKRIILFGRNESYKNFEYAYKIAPYAQQDGYEIHIFSKNLHSETSENVKVNNEYLKNERLFDEIANSCLVLVPYTSATQSGVIIKALENGTPVIVSQLPGLKEDCNHESLGTCINVDDHEKNSWIKIRQFLETWDSYEFNNTIVQIADELPSDYFQ